MRRSTGSTVPEASISGGSIRTIRRWFSGRRRRIRRYGGSSGRGTPELGAPPFAWGAADSGTDSDPGTAWEPAIRENHRRVYDAYGQERYRLRLEEIYRRVLADRDLVDGSDGPLDKEKLLFSFLDPQMIFLVTSLSPELGGGQ
jgi:hypothetical protein